MSTLPSIPLAFDPTKTRMGWLIRHGELNLGNRWDGWGNYTLSPEGIESAEKAAQWLSFERIGRIVASDTIRTQQTADIIMSRCNVSCPYISFDPNLRAWYVAGFTGKEKTPERVAEFKQYCDNPDLVVPDGESRNQMKERITTPISQYLATPYNGLPTAMVVHNSVIKCFMGLDDLKEAVAPGGVIAVYMNEQGGFEFEIVLGGIAPEKGVS